MLKLLVNTVGADADTVELTTGSMDSDYFLEDMMFGHRCRYVRSQTSGGAGNYIEFAYSSLNSTTKPCDHVVIGGAHRLITSGGIIAQPQEKNSGGTWSNLGSAWTVSSNDLIGNPVGRRTYGQDYVFEVTSAQEYGYRVQFETDGGDEAVMFSKLFFCEAFDFGHNPSIKENPTWESAQDRVKPKYGTRFYDITARTILTWEGVTRAKIDIFRNLPHILEHPIFLYESSSGVLKFDIENVLVEGWREKYIEDDIWDIDITFGRLRHYE